MPSILPDFEYDIFISYRQNDNKKDGWVTSFVQALRDELEATLKNPVSIYFDENPHDGLLETHQVNATLDNKLKCIVFIPIISQTYCDPNGYAWSQELLPFLESAKTDSIGINIELSNGNVVSRVLPVRIHDLDSEDQQLLEEKLNGPLRCLDFIYKEPGVNRSLKPSDKRELNQEKTAYHNQINKVANALKEIGNAVLTQNNDSERPRVSMERAQPPSTTSSRKLIYGLAAVTLLSILIFYLFRDYSLEPDSVSEKLRVDKSLVVLPFEDMSPGKDQEWFSDGLSEELLNQLARVKELKLISRTTSFSFKGKGLSAKAIADSLGVAYVLEGSVRKADEQLRITAQLINARDDSHIWSKNYDYGIDSIFKIQEDIAQNITGKLDILLDENTAENMFKSGTSNFEAYEIYLQGNALFNAAHADGTLLALIDANEHYERALQLDPKLADAYFSHADLVTHNLIGGENADYFAGISEEEKMNAMQFDLNSAVLYTNHADRKLTYRFAQAYLSNDWIQLRTIFENNREELRSGWYHVLILLDPETVVRYYLDIIALDKFRSLNRAHAALSLSRMGLVDSAKNLYKDGVHNQAIGVYMRSLLAFYENDYNEALRILESGPYKSSYFLLMNQLLSGQRSLTVSELDLLVDSLGVQVSTAGESPIQLYSTIGEYEKADSVAAIIDSKALGHCSLSTNFWAYGLNFHLDATPNFTARLRELGVDPEQFEKKHYWQISKK